MRKEDKNHFTIRLLKTSAPLKSKLYIQEKRKLQKPNQTHGFL